MSKFILYYFYFYIYCQGSFEDINIWYKELKDNANPGIKIILVGNKCDLEEVRVVKQKDVDKIMDDFDIDLSMETSARTGENVEQLFVEATKLLYKEYMSLQNKMNKKDSNNKIKLEKTTEDNKEESKCNC